MATYRAFSRPDEITKPSLVSITLNAKRFGETSSQGEYIRKIINQNTGEPANNDRYDVCYHNGNYSNYSQSRVNYVNETMEI